MKIPWKKLARDPIVVEIDEIYVVVGPHFGELAAIVWGGLWCVRSFLPTDRPYDPEWERKRKLKKKEEQIKKYKKAAKELKASES